MPRLRRNKLISFFGGGDKHVDDDVSVKEILQKSSPASSLHTVSLGSMNVESLIGPKRAEKSSEYDSMGELGENLATGLCRKEADKVIDFPLFL